MINKVVVIILSIISVIVILALIIYFANKKNKNNDSSIPEPTRCKGDICGNHCCDEGLHCQSDKQTCCKNELWGKNESGFDICCGSPLCGDICCDKSHNCGIDKNGNKVCCGEKLCGKNNLCCSVTGEECQEDTICCDPKLWDTTNKKCCTKPLCNGICCEDSEQCDTDTGKCLPCPTDLCNGECCGTDTCYKGATKKACCDKELCGDDCCWGEGNQCITIGGKKTCCKEPCGGIPNPDGKTTSPITCCNDPTKPYCNGDQCCADNNGCKDENKTHVCYNQSLCNIDKDHNCLCCQTDEKLDPVSKTCKTYCGIGKNGEDVLCDSKDQCLFIYDKDNINGYYGCINDKCVWDSTLNESDPPPITNTDKSSGLAQIIPTCVSNKKYYTINNPVGPDGKQIPLSDLSRKVFITEDKSSNQCGITDCYKKLNEFGINRVGIDDTVQPIQCQGDYKCMELLKPYTQGMQCPLTDNQESCCNNYDSNGQFINYTGQICPNGQSCYKNQCVCTPGQDPTTNNCIIMNGDNWCHSNGNPDFHTGKCHCTVPYTFGDNCEITRDTLCNSHGNPNADKTTCQCDKDYYGDTCNIYGPTFCNYNGTPVLINNVWKCSCTNPDFSCTDINLITKYPIILGNGIVSNGYSGDKCQCSGGNIFNSKTNTCTGILVDDVTIKINFPTPFITKYNDNWWIAYIILLPGVVVDVFDVPNGVGPAGNPIGYNAITDFSPGEFNVHQGTLQENNYVMSDNVAIYKNKPIPVKMSMLAYQLFNTNKNIFLTCTDGRTYFFTLTIIVDTNGNISISEDYISPSNYTNYTSTYKTLPCIGGNNNKFNYVIIGKP